MRYDHTTMSERTTLDLLLELQALDRVPRTGYALHGIADPESVAEHTFHLVFLVWTLARDEPSIDRARAVELALVHDLPEVRTGDLPRTISHHLPTGVKAATEHAIAAELFAPDEEEPCARLAEYQQGATAEARFVRACDKLQIGLKVAVYEGWGHGGLDEFWEGLAHFDDAGFASIRATVDAIRARRKDETR